MKKKLISSGIIAGFLAFLLALMPLLKDSSASALGYDSSSNSIVYTHYANKRADNAAELGSAENPYIIMELVPKDDMAMIGYLVSNQGKVSEKALASQFIASSNDAAAIYKRLFESTTETIRDDVVESNGIFGGTDTVSTSRNESRKAFTDDVTDTANNETYQNSGLKPDFAQYGYFEKVDTGDGRYDLIQGDDGAYRFVKNSNNTGNYKWVALGEFNRVTDGSTKTESQYVFNRDLSGYHFSHDDDGYYYTLNEKNTYIDLDNGSTYEVPKKGVHKYSNSDGTFSYLDRNGSALTENTDKNDNADDKYTGTYGSYTTYIDSDGWTYYNYSGNNLKFRVKKSGNTWSNYYISSNGSEHILTLADDGYWWYSDSNSNTIYITKAGTFEDASHHPIYIKPNGDYSGAKDISEGSGSTASSVKPSGKQAAPAKKVILFDGDEDEEDATPTESDPKTKTDATSETGTGTNSKSTVNNNSTNTNTNTTTTNSETNTQTNNNKKNAPKANTTTNNNTTTTPANDSNDILPTTTSFNSTTKSVTAAITASKADSSMLVATANISGNPISSLNGAATQSGTPTPAVDFSNLKLYTSQDISIGHNSFVLFDPNTDQDEDVYNYTSYSGERIGSFSNPATDLAALVSGSGSVTRYYTARFDASYCMTYQYVIKNNDTLAKKILGKGAYDAERNPDGAHIEVVPVTPAEINAATNRADFINDADMIVIHDMLDARLVKDSNDYKRDLVPADFVDGNGVSHKKGEEGYHYILNTAGYKVKNASGVVTESTVKYFHGDDAAGLLESAVVNDIVDGTSLMESSDSNTSYTGDARTAPTFPTGMSASSGATRGYFTSSNDIEKDVLDLLVRRQASGSPAAMILDSSAIYKESSTDLSTPKTTQTSSGAVTTEESPNYHDGVPSALTVSFKSNGYSGTQRCSDPVNHTNPNSPNYLHPDSRNSNGNLDLCENPYSIEFTNNTSTPLGMYSMTIMLPSYIFFDTTTSGQMGNNTDEYSITNHIVGDVNELTITFYNKQDHPHGETAFMQLTSNGVANQAGLWLECLQKDQDKANQVDLNKCPITFRVTDGTRDYSSSKFNQDVAERLNELYIINNYYGAKYYYNIYCAKRGSDGKITGDDIPDYTDPSITGYADDTDAEHSYPVTKLETEEVVVSEYYKYSKYTGKEINEIRDALKPLTMDVNNPYNYYSTQAQDAASITLDNYGKYVNTHLTQGSYGNGIGKSPFVWDFDGNRSAFSTAFNMSKYTTAAVADGTKGTASLTALNNTDGKNNACNIVGTASNIVKAASTGLSNEDAAKSDAKQQEAEYAALTGTDISNVDTTTSKDYGITRPQYMDSEIKRDDSGNPVLDANGNTIANTDDTNLDEVFDQRFAKDASGNVLAVDASGNVTGTYTGAEGTTAALQVSITRADMLAFINKEAQGYNGTTGDKYKTSLKILEVEPTDEFVYGSYYQKETDDAASDISDSKYATKLGGISMKTNIDYYSNFDAIKKGFVYAATGRTTIPQQNKDNIRYYFSGGDNQQQIRIDGATSAADYIGYNRQSWKDWKEYFYSMIPGFIGSGVSNDGASVNDYMNDVTIETMPVWKFNANNVDINSEYDIIVVGATQNYKNGQLKRIYSYGSNANQFWVDTHRNRASINSKVYYRRWICYNDPNLESYNTNQLGVTYYTSQWGSWANGTNNVGTPSSHDTMGDPSYALAWTAVGDYVDTSSGNSSINEGWYANDTKNVNTPYAYSGNVVINTVSSAWINTRFTKQPTSATTTIISNGGSDASQAGTRYEARDLTKKKAEALLDFADRNLLLIDDSVYLNDSVDGNLVDSRSEMYYVANTYFGGQKNISMPSSIKDNRSLFNVRKNTLLTQCDFSTDGIADAKWPVEYSYTDNPMNATSNSQKVNGDDGLVFTVSVDGKKYNNDGTLKTYNINVYNDVNNNSVYDGSLSEQRKTLSFAYNDENKNGIYDSGDTQPVSINAGTSEKLTAVSIYDITDSSNKIEISSTQHYPYDAIYAGRKYSVEAALSDNYFGAIGYKFEISEGHIDDISEGMSADDRNASLRSEKTGLTRFRQAGKKIIHILQINPVADMRNNAPNNTMAFYTMNAFKTQMNNVPDFYVEIDFLQNNASNGFYDYDKGQWLSGSFTTGDVTLTPSNNSGRSGCVAETWPLVQSKNGDFKFTLHDLTDFSLFLENYDMVFLAGRDSAMVSNDPVFIKGLDKYSAQGGSIIMSHDMVSSFFNIHSISSADNRFSAWNRQMMLQIYYLQKLQGQVEKYYTPGTTNYSYNTMYASSNPSKDREKSVMMPLEATFALALNKSNARSGTVLNDAAIANDVRFADQYDFTNSSEYLDKVVDDTLATGNRSYGKPDPYSGKYNDSPDNDRAIMTRDANNGSDLRFDRKYPAGWQSADSSRYADGSWPGQTEGEYAKYFASLVTNNDLYNLEHYVTSNVNQNLIEDVNSFGLCGRNSSTDLAIKNWGWVPTTDRIQNVNKGKVSSYPFDMSKDESHGLVGVTTTHMQQYRLDLDHTNDPAPLVDGKMSNITDDTIVWYNLANTDNNYLYNFQKGDSANNYYIYTKGNITYTGVGHSSVSQASEIRLFINTMIASYRPAEGTPYIKVTNSDIRTSGDTTTVYFDESTGNTGIITFQVMDPTLANIKRDYYLKVYEVDPDGTERLATNGTITEDPSAEHVLSLYSGNTLTNAVGVENDDTKLRHVRELQNAPMQDSDGTSINNLVSGEYGFSYKVQKGGRYCFQGDVGKKYCIHLCYRNYKTNSAKNKVDYGLFKEVRHYVKLQKLEYFDLY